MAALSRSDGHVGLRPRCGICGSSMEVAERFVLLLGNVDSMAFSKRLGPYTFPDYGHRLRGKSSVSLCRKPDCSLCAVSAEASIAHSDCFDFVAQRCKLDDCLDHLWVITAWRTPWRQAPHFGLQETIVEPDWSVFDDFGISSVRLLPPEMLGIIHGYSATSLFWRFNAASKLTRRLPATLPDCLLSIPLGTVAAWKRGGQPVTIEMAHQLPVIRLTIDSWGIREVERLPGHPQFRTWRTDSLVFVILDQTCLKDVTAYFKFGLLRLELPKTCHGLQTWDTPTPPNLQRCLFYPANIVHSTRFRTIELWQTSGITFFFCHGEIYAVHAHTLAAPCAHATYQRLSRRRQQSVTWVYVPISRKDCIATLGARMSLSERTTFGSTCLLFRMKLGGDVSVGLASSKQTKDLLLSKSPPTTIIYNTLELQPVSVIGAYPTGEEENTPIAPFHHPLIDDPPFPNACFSLAPLESVNRMSIFNNEHTGLCMGILLQYENGAQRSLGQCRVGVDSTEDYVKPVRICFRRQVYTRSGTSVQLQATTVTASSSGQEYDHNEQGWMCFDMQGELEFWFSCEETQLTAIVDQ